MESRPWIRHYDPLVPATMNYPHIPATHLLGNACMLYPDKSIYWFFGSEMSYWDFFKLVARMSNAFAGLGIQKGDRVCIQLPNCPQYMVAYYGTLLLGGIVVNANPMYTADELKHIVTTTEPKMLVTFSDVLPTIHKLCEDVEISQVIVTKVMDFVDTRPASTAKELDLPEGWHHFSELLDESKDTRLPRAQVAPEDPALIQFTGGTTGVPKGAVTTHRNIVSASFQYKSWGNALLGYGTAEDYTMMSLMPFFHSYGNACHINAGVLSCATLIIVPRFELDEVMEIVSQFEDISNFPMVPTMITAILNHPRAEELEIGKRIGMVGSGGAPLAVEVLEKARDMNIRVNEGYGLTESTSVCTANPVLGMKKSGTVGIPFMDVDVRIVDPNEGKEDVPKGEPGELIMRGPNVIKEYWKNPEETANQLRDGWLYTGDIAVQDEDDYFAIVDRKKDMIVAGGYNIYPRDIDEVLYQNPKVLQAVAVGVPDEYRGETVKAFVVLKEGETATDKEIIDFCREKLAPYKAPKIVEFRDSLPTSATGKLLRQMLRAEEEAKSKK
jgi:long-chain acyl-CoA synthetase